MVVHEFVIERTGTIVDVTNVHVGNTISEETRQKLRNRGFSPEHRAKLSAELYERWATEGYRERLAANRKPRTNIPQIKTYHFVLNGEDITITNLAKYCRENNIRSNKMRDVAAGRRRSHKGYTKKS
jgi:hypothetical protein